MEILLSLLSKVWGYIVGGLALVAAVFAIRRSGAKAEQDKEQAQAAKEMKDASEIDDNVRKLSESDIDKRMSKYIRKN